MNIEIFKKDYAQARTFINPDAIPNKLKQHPFWNVWKYEFDTDRPKPRKTPYNVNANRKRGKSTDTTTFDIFSKANAVYQADNFYSGLGIGIFGNICGIDIDNCLDEDGMPSELAQDLIDTMQSYTEISPSGKGIRIFAFINETFDRERYEAEYRKKNDAIGLEIYIGDTTGRYLTVTGNIGDADAPIDIADRTSEVMQILNKYMQKEINNKLQIAEQKQLEMTPTMSSPSVSGYYPENFLKTVADVLEHAMNAKNGDKFNSLFKGNISGYESHSQADQAFCNLLAFWCGCDTGLMDSVFRQSNLIRNKWDEKHGNQTYGEMTIETAIASCTEVYNPQKNVRQQAREKHQKYISPYDTDGTGRLTIVNLQAYMKTKGFSVAYDEILRENVFGTVDGESKLHLPETMPTIIKDDLQGELKGVNRDNICAMLDLIASRNIVNPIRSMIEGTKWDGIDRLKQFYDLFEIPETDTLSRILIRKWAMQCVCGLYNRYEQPYSLDIILVFQGKQGIAKTRFFEHLAMMPEYFKESAVLDPANKDSVIECTGVWIAELGEIGSTMRKDIDRVKGFLTQSTDTYRQPYGRKALKYPRRTSFVGTVNDEKFLLDTTGNRRFASVPLQLTHTLDYETQIKAFDALQFWAQILQIVRDAIKQGGTYGGCFRLDETEKANLETRNSSLLKLLPFEQEFLDTIQHYEEQKAKNPKFVEWRFCTSTDWLVQNRYRMGNCSAVQLGKILAKNGYERKVKKINGAVKYGYELPFELSQTIC